MIRPIMITYTPDATDRPIEVPVMYDVIECGNMLMLCCAIQQVKEYPVPQWLRPFKFEVKLLIGDNTYETLYSDTSTHNLDSALFIDKAAEQIMINERKLPKPKPAATRKAMAIA